MAARIFRCTETEIVYIGKDQGGFAYCTALRLYPRIQVHSVSCEQIRQIVFTKSEGLGFAKKPNERIEIHLQGHDHSLVISRSKQQRFFEEYKTELRNFAKRHQISFIEDGRYDGPAGKQNNTLETCSLIGSGFSFIYR